MLSIISKKCGCCFGCNAGSAGVAGCMEVTVVGWAWEGTGTGPVGGGGGCWGHTVISA